MNEAFGQRSTVATIGGAKETLTFGVRYSIRHGDDDVLRDVLLGERAPNGDLIFYRTDLASSSRADSRYRVRPSTIDSIVETIDSVDVPAGMTAQAYLAHVEEILGGAYSRWTGTDEGQRILRAAYEEDRRGRNGVGPKVDPEPGRLPRGICSRCGADVAVRRNGAVREHRAIPSGPVCAGAGLPPRGVEDEPLPVPSEEDIAKLAELNRQERAKRKPEPVGAILERVVPAPSSSSEPRSWRDRNQVWRCPICKRRTRAASCSNGHPEELAPAGKRRESRS